LFVEQIRVEVRWRDTLMRNMLENREIHGIEVKSAGTHAINGISPLPKVVEICKQHGIDISSHSSLPLAEEMVKDSDITLIMEKEQLKLLLKSFRRQKESKGAFFL